MDEVRFPASREEALAYLYMQHQDLSGKSPEEINTIYWEAFYAIQADDEAKEASGWRDGRDPNYKKTEWW